MVVQILNSKPLKVIYITYGVFFPFFETIMYDVDSISMHYLITGYIF